jgi:hypothetical protein
MHDLICPSCGKVSGVPKGAHGIDSHNCINCKVLYGVMYIAGFNDGMSSNKKRRENKIIKKEIGICKQFLLENGWSKDHDESEACEFDSYHKNNSISIDISDSEIVFIDDSGDFLHLDLNYFTLVGLLIEYRQVGFNYTSTK